jgi:hypothetical protein
VSNQGTNDNDENSDSDIDDINSKEKNNNLLPGPASYSPNISIIKKTTNPCSAIFGPKKKKTSEGKNIFHQKYSIHKPSPGKNKIYN